MKVGIRILILLLSVFAVEVAIAQCSGEPDVRYGTHTSITHNSATLGGEVEGDGPGNCTISEIGVVWGTSPDPDETDNEVSGPAVQSGTFTVNVTGLPSGQLIYYRAYGVNEVGRDYANEQSFFTYAEEPQAHALTLQADASNDQQIELTFPPASDIVHADGYILLMRIGDDPTTDGLNDGAVPSGATYYKDRIDDANAVDYTVWGLDPGTTYHFAIIPYNRASGENQTYNYLTTPGFPTANATTEHNVDIDGETGGLAIGSLNSGATDVALIGFSLEPTGPMVFEEVNINLSSTTAGKLTNFRLVESTDATYTNVAEDPVIVQATGITVTATLITVDMSSENLTTTDKRYFFLIADVDASVNSSVADVEFSYDEGDFLFTPNNKRSGSQTRSYAFLDTFDPEFTSTAPSSGATIDITTSTFTITFNENIDNVGGSTNPANPDHTVRLYEVGNATPLETIARNDNTVGTTGAIYANGSSATATIEFVYDLEPHKSYYILIGNDVFRDADDNKFAGFYDPADWAFSTSGVTVTAPTASICSGSFQPVGDIVIEETGVGDFRTGSDVTLILELENTSEFALSNAGVTATGTGPDISNVSVTVGLATVTITYTISGTTGLDAINITGLQAYATGAVTPTTLRRTGGTAQQSANDGLNASSLTYATINVGGTPPPLPVLAPSQDLTYCEGEDLSTATLTLQDDGATSYRWYKDAGLTTLAVDTNDETVNLHTDLQLTSPAVAGTYKFYVVAVSNCQSAPPIEVVVTVTPTPVADAGVDKTVCPGTPVTLGGNPTLAVPSAPGTYTYSWDYLEGAPEPDPTANPVYTVENSSSTSVATYTFEVSITDVNGCTGSDAVTVEVKPSFEIELTSPASRTFTPQSPNQTLEATPPGGVFSGVGVVQTSNPAGYQFSPEVAHQTDPNTLPKQFPIYYTVTYDGCTISNKEVATITISNSFFGALQAQYCASEYPNPTAWDPNSGVNLSFDKNGFDYMTSVAASWNASSRVMAIQAWSALATYPENSYVRYNSEIYKCTTPGGCLPAIIPPTGWTPQPNMLRTIFKGGIGNYWEDVYGGNTDGSTTVVHTNSPYTVEGQTFNYYRLGTNVNYARCPTCVDLYPAAFLDLVQPKDVIYLLPTWSVSFNYGASTVVRQNDQAYRAKSTVPAGTAVTNTTYWENVTNADFSNGTYFHKWDPITNAFRGGIYVTGQIARVNRNPDVSFTGLVNGQKVCKFETWEDENSASSTGSLFELVGSNANNPSQIQEFLVRLDGASTFDYGSGAIQNQAPAGNAVLNTKIAFDESPQAGTTKNITVRYRVDPGTEGSTSQPCYGTSDIVISIVENSRFDFAESVPTNAVFCYTESPIDLHAAPETAPGNPFTGAAGTPNSVTFEGFGVSNPQASVGQFHPGAALNQQSPGTRAQQTISVTAVYLDANLCKTTEIHTFKVNPEIKPSFSFNGRANYCYEDVANSFTGHQEDFTIGGSTVTSSGRYDFSYQDPGNTVHSLALDNSTNTSFLARTFYDDVQNLLSSEGFESDMNQITTISVMYTEVLNAGKVCEASFVQSLVINPPAVLDIFGLNDGDILCRNDNNVLTQGNLVTFDGSVTGAGVFSLDDDPDFSAVNPTLNSTVNTASGKATINLLNAYNAASDVSDPRQVYLEYRYTAPGCTGPASVVKGFEISPPPSIAFDFTNSASPAAGSVFCNDAEVVGLKTVQNTNVSLNGFGITDSGTGVGTATFNPGLAYSTSISSGGTINAKQNITVGARIVDAIGCANTTSIVYTVNPTPTATVNFEKSQFCYEDDPALIQGGQGNSWFDLEYLGVTTPYNEDIGTATVPQPQFTFNPKPRFDHAINLGASSLTPVDFNVYYTAADGDGCTNTIGPFLVSVANRIEVQIAGIAEEDNTYCSNRTNGSTPLSFNPFPADETKREFLINGDLQSLTSNKFDFRPPLHGGDFTLEYVVYSGESNCSNTETLNVKVLPSPRAIFTTVPGCEDDTIQFTADGSQNLAHLDPLYTWTLVDSVITGQTVHHRFNGTNLFGVNLKVEYPAYNNDPLLVCKDSLRLDQVIGANPTNLNFAHSNVCENDDTQLSIAADIPISRISWDFGDGVATPLGFSADPISGIAQTTGNFQTPLHSYASAGQYRVVVTGKTADVFGGCELTEEHYISILTNWSPTPGHPYYNMAMIEGGDGGWVPEHDLDNPTWEFASAAKKHIVTQEPAWITNDAAPYPAGDASFVNSPCFDLSGFTRPVISIHHWTDTEASDGAVLQYSVDGGTTWDRLGDVASGLDWYNRLTISSNPGRQDNLSSGWSSAGQNEWAVGKHSLDVIPFPRDKVRFRVAFASFNNAEGRDGFAFNNIVIEERNRTVLVENFTHNNQVDNNRLFRDFRSINADGDINPLELVKLQYHHAPAVPNATPDAINKVNPVDQNARAAFYGITNPVRAFIDGGFGQSSSNATFMSNDIGTYFSLRSLVTSPVILGLEFINSPDDKLNVKATVKTTGNLPDPGKYNVFIAIAEKSVTTTVDGNDIEQLYVLRKFLPSAAGTPLSVASPADPAQEINVSYDMRHVTRQSDGSFAPFAVIVFVQHLETKDVLQTMMREDGTASPDIVTGTDPALEGQVLLYPNPADAILHVVLPAPVQESVLLKMFDSYGRQVFTRTMEAGESVGSIPVKDLAGGVYVIELATPNGVVRKKAMVVHD